MITDLEEITAKLRRGWTLRHDALDGWRLEARNGVQLPKGAMPHDYEVAASSVALLAAQGIIRTELRLVGKAVLVENSQESPCGNSEARQ